MAQKTSPGDIVLTGSADPSRHEGRAAAHTGVRRRRVAMDEQGVLPDARVSACRQYRPKAVYLTPTIHNPTTATMPPARRAEIAELVRANDLLLFEDDAYGMLEPGAKPLACLIPETDLSPQASSEMHRAGIAGFRSS